MSIGEKVWLEAARDTENPSRNLALREREAALTKGWNVCRSIIVRWWCGIIGSSYRLRRSAGAVGISAEAARKLWTRALGRLRKELGPAHDSR